MRVKVLSTIAALLLVSACASEGTDTGNTAGAGNAATNQTAPAERMGPMAGSAEDFVVNVGDRVFFDYDKSTLSSAAQDVLNRQAQWLKTFPSVTLVIEGHADERGTREYNLALGERRAQAAKDYLMALGVSADRLSTTSFGEERPVALGHNEAAWAQNRRSVSVPKISAGS